MTTPTHNGQATYAPAYRQPTTPAPTDFSGIAILKGMMLTLRQQLDDARDQVFHIDLDVYRDNVAGASTHAMKLTGELSADRQAQCESNFEAICRAAPDAMANAVERLLQAHYMVAAAENDPNNPAKLLPLMTLSWVIGMAVGLVRDVDVLAAQKKRKDHAAAGAIGGKARLSKFSMFDEWVKANKDSHKGTPMDKARAMVRVIPVEIANAIKDPQRRIYDLLRGEISYK